MNNTEKIEAFNHLNPSDQKIALFVGQGLGNKEIARTIRKAPSTVKNSVTGILRTLGAGSRLGLAVCLVQADLLNPLQFIETKGLTVSHFEALSEKERSYLYALSGLKRGNWIPLSNKMIARETGLALSTVKNGLHEIGVKLGMGEVNRTTLTMLALAHQKGVKQQEQPESVTT